MSLPWFKKNKALSNCKTEADIVAMSAIRTSLRTELRAVRNGIPGIEEDVDTYQSILDKENILINLFCNKQKSPIDRNVDYSHVVEEFRRYLCNTVRTCSVEQATSNKPVTKPDGKPSTEPATEATTEATAEPTTEPATEATAEPTAEPTTEPITEPAIEVTAEPTAEPTTEPDDKPVIEKSVAEVISELSSESTMASINNVMNKYNIHYIGIGMDEFINFCKEVNEFIVDPIVKKYMDRVDNNDKKIIDLHMIEIFKNIARKSRNTIIGTIQSIAQDHGIAPVISLYNTGEIDVQFNGDSFTIKPDAKYDDQILIDRRGKIIIKSQTTKGYYYIPLKVRDNNKNVLNTRALTELLVNGSESVIKQNMEGTAPYYIKEMYDEPTKAIVPVFKFESIPTNLSNERKTKIIELIFNAIPKIVQDIGGLTEMTSLVDIKDDRIILYAAGKNGRCNYDLGFDPEKAQAEVVDTASAAAIPEDTNKVDSKPEDQPTSPKKPSSNKKKKKPEQTASTESTSSAEEHSSNPQENTPVDDTSADEAAS